MSKRSRIVRRRMRAHENRNWAQRVIAQGGYSILPVTKYSPEEFERLVFNMPGTPVYDHSFPDLEADPIIGRVRFAAVDKGPDGEARITCELVFKEGTTREQIADYATITGLKFTPTDRMRRFMESEGPPFNTGKL